MPVAGQLKRDETMEGTKRLDRLSESQTLALSKEARRLKATGRDIVGLTLGEPDFDTPMHIREAAITAIQEGFTHYTPVAGIPDLREGIAKKLREFNDIPVQKENIVVSTGAKQSLVNTIMSLVNPDEEVILIKPYWVSYREMLKMADAKIVELETSVESEFKITPEQLAAAITPATRLILFNSPNNPTGTMYTPDEIRALAKVMEPHKNMYILSDEIYEHINYGTELLSFASIPEIFDRTVTINGFSKGYAMTGWRLGYAAAPVWIAQLCEKYQGQVTSGANSVAQKAGVAAINGPMEESKAFTAEFKERRDFIASRLDEMEGVVYFMPPGAFYFYPDLSAFFGKTTPKGKVIEDIDDLNNYFLYDCDLAFIPGSAFGTKKHIRISYAYSMEALTMAMDRMKSSLEALK